MTKALLFLSFGGPNGPDDVVDFMANVTRGRNIPRERLAEVSKHYFLFGGKSPINEINLELIARTEAALAQAGISLPVYFGNRNWEPYLSDTVEKMIGDGIDEALVFATSAYGSYSGCRQYREDLANARQRASNPSLRLFKLRHFYNHPDFVKPLQLGSIAAIERLSATFHLSEIEVLFSAHSVPLAMAQSSDYLPQLGFVARHVKDAISSAFPQQIGHSQVFQSRSGPPHQPWLEPDISDAMRSLCRDGKKRAFVVVPVGFISDHMEVIYDLDTLARQTAAELGAGFERVPTSSSSASFTNVIVDLVKEQLYLGYTAPHLEGDPQPLAQCRQDCCLISNP